MGRQTVSLVHRTWDYYDDQVDTDVAEMAAALRRWLEGKADTPPQLQDAAELRKLAQDWFPEEEDYRRVKEELVTKRQHRATPAASTVGQLIERLQGLDPELPISLVVGEKQGQIDVIEPLA